MKPLAFIIGQDSLLNFPSWYQYETILENSHLLVCRRPGYPLTMRDAQHQQWLDAHLTDNIEDLHSLPAGKIYLAETPWFDISATLIRERLQQGLDCDDLLPRPCWPISLRTVCIRKVQMSEHRRRNCPLMIILP